jgi:hypothetical protein
MRTHAVKSLIERLLGNKVWIEPSSDLDETRAFIRQLAPRDIGIALKRIGSAGDGGYLVPDDLAGIGGCLSPGVSTEIGFDLEMASRGIPVFMADASVAGPPQEHDLFHFYPKFLDVVDDEKNMRLERLVAEASAHTADDLLLQMDIEGAEYRVLLDASDEVLQRFRIILLECHHLSRLFGRQNSQLMTATFRKLLRHFHIVHIHPNNVCAATCREDVAIPPVMEFTLVRKDRARTEPRGGLSFPHPLDSDNVTTQPSLVLPEIWR